MNLSHYTKFIVAVLGVIVGALAAALGDDFITLDEAVNLGIVALGAIATYIVPNLETGVMRYSKLIVGSLTAGLTLLASLTTDGITMSEWLMVGAAVVTAFTTYALPNQPLMPKFVGPYDWSDQAWGFYAQPGLVEEIAVTAASPSTDTAPSASEEEEELRVPVQP